MKSILVIIISLLTGITTFSRASSSDTIYFDKNWNKTTKENSTYYRLIHFQRGLYYVKDYYNNGALQMEGACSGMKPKGDESDNNEGPFTWYYKSGIRRSTKVYVNGQMDGASISYYESGKISYRGMYTKGEKDGAHISYYESGQIADTGIYVMGEKEGEFVYYYEGEEHKVRRKEYFINDTLQEGKCFTLDGKDTVYFPAYEKPRFPGGEKGMKNYVDHQLSYPVDAMYAGIEGKVVIKFVILKTGKIDSIEVFKSVSPILDESALEMIRMMPPWEPAKKEGVPVDFWYNFPINYKLE